MVKTQRAVCVRLLGLPWQRTTGFGYQQGGSLLSLSPWSVDTCPHMVVLVCVGVPMSSYKDTGHSGLGPIPMTS